MKKIVLLLTCVVLLLCACGNQEQPQESAPTVSTQTPTDATEATQPPETTTPPTQETEPITEPTESEDSLLALAKTCIDQSVEELYALIGEPETSDYAPSCLGDGEDGNLYYDGFIVYTYREGNTETVRYVE